jgi:hypothetical protein
MPSRRQPVGDAEDLMVGLGRLMEQFGDLGAVLVHPDGLLGPERLAPGGDGSTSTGG